MVEHLSNVLAYRKVVSVDVGYNVASAVVP